MTSSRQWIPFGGLLATIAMACYAVMQLHAQAQVQVPAADFRSAAMAEVRDARGQVVLQGQFMDSTDDDDDERERHAVLAAAGADTDAGGEAEVEFARTGATMQEVELTILNLAPRTTFTVAFDGIDVATVTTNQRGRAELDLDIRMPGA